MGIGAAVGVRVGVGPGDGVGPGVGVGVGVGTRVGVGPGVGVGVGARVGVGVARGTSVPSGVAVVGPGVGVNGTGAIFKETCRSADISTTARFPSALSTPSQLHWRLPWMAAAMATNAPRL